MTANEFVTQRESERKAFEARMRELDLNYAKSVNKIRIGDTVEDKFGKMIIVKSYVLCRSNDFKLPHFDYRGIKLTKKGLPRKDGDISTTYYEHVVKINGKEILLEGIQMKEGGVR